MWYYPSTGMPLLAVVFTEKRILFSQQFVFKHFKQL